MSIRYCVCANSLVSHARAPPTRTSPDWMRALPFDSPNAMKARMRSSTQNSGRRGISFRSSQRTSR